MLASGVRGRLAAPRWQLAACSSMHVVNDALFAGLYPLLPLVAADLGLSYAQVGAIKTVYSGASAVLQVPAGLLAERWGEQQLLALGTGWVGLGLAAMAFASGFWGLLALACVAGLGGNIQHPAAASVVSRLFDTGRRGTAIGTLNFAGDLGKVLAPALAGAVALAVGWRGGFLALAGFGAAFAVVYWLVVPQPDRASAAQGQGAETAPGAAPGWGISQPLAFGVLSLVGMLDAAARGTALTFLPFVLTDKGLDAAAISLIFGVLFAAGAAGKLICGPLSDRYGSTATVIATELVTAGAVIGLLWASSASLLLAIVPLGFVLNGTSSVLYASVAELVHAERRARGYGLYYTATQLASALAPILYGLLADRVGLNTSLSVLAGATACIAPLAVVMRWSRAA
jgi:MFS transporter, FSR family, fosmidomycin resistance protein